MNFITAIFHGALVVAGFVTKELGYITQAGAIVRSLEPQLEALNTNPDDLYAKVLKDVFGFTDEATAKIQQIGKQVAGIGPFVEVLQGALAEFQAGQPVTGTATIFHKYNYAFTPAT